MIKNHLAATAVLFWLINSSPPAQGAPDHLGAPPYQSYDNVGGGYYVGQVFQAESNWFSGVKLYIGDPDRLHMPSVNELVGPADLLLWDATDFNAPVLLKSESVQDVGGSAFGLTTFDWNTPVATTVGTRYFFSLFSADQYGVGIRNISGSTYDNGGQSIYREAGHPNQFTIDPIVGTAARDYSFEVLNNTPTQIVWTGNNSNSWNDPLNWDVLAVPDGSVPVLIDNGNGNASTPQLGDVATLSDFTIDAGDEVELLIDSSLSLSGTFTLNGTLRSTSPWNTRIVDAQGATATITGQLLAQNGSTVQYHGDIDNQGIIAADDGYLIHSVSNTFANSGTYETTSNGHEMIIEIPAVSGDHSNSGTIKSQGGSMSFAIYDETGSFSNSGEIAAVGGSLDLANYSLNFESTGTIAASNGGDLEIINFGHLTNSGTILAASGTLEINNQGTLNNNGTIQADGNNIIVSHYGTWNGNGVEIINGGNLHIAGGTVYWNDTWQISDGTLIVNGGNVDLQGNTLTNVSGGTWQFGEGTIYNGTIGDNGNTSAFVATGTALEDVTIDGTIQTDGWLYLRNTISAGPHGTTVRHSGGGAYYLENPVAFAGGDFVIEDNVQLYQSGHPFEIQAGASVTFTGFQQMYGSGSYLINSGTLRWNGKGNGIAAQYDSQGESRNYGTIEVINTANPTFTQGGINSLQNFGVLYVDASSTLTINGTFQHLDGTLHINGVFDPSSFNFWGGRLIGNGSILTGFDVQNATISPGESIGTFTITETLTFYNAILEIELGGPGESDLLAAEIPVFYGSTGNFLSLSGGVLGETYTIMTFTPGSLVGTFDGWSEPETYALHYDNLNGLLQVTVVPEPSAALLLTLGSLALVARRRRTTSS